MPPAASSSSCARTESSSSSAYDQAYETYLNGGVADEESINLSENLIQDGFHSYLRSSLTQAKTERLLNEDILSSAEADLMITGPALCLYFAALRSTTNPPSVPLPKPKGAPGHPKQPTDLSYQNCPPAFKSFLKVWAYNVPLIQDLLPEHQHDLARIICGLPPLCHTPNPSLGGIAADLRGVAIEISQRRSFQERYGEALQAALDSNGPGDAGGSGNASAGGTRRASFVPPPSYDSAASTTTPPTPPQSIGHSHSHSVGSTRSDSSRLSATPCVSQRRSFESPRLPPRPTEETRPLRIQPKNFQNTNANPNGYTFPNTNPYVNPNQHTTTNPYMNATPNGRVPNPYLTPPHSAPPGSIAFPVPSFYPHTTPPVTSSATTSASHSHSQSYSHPTPALPDPYTNLVLPIRPASSSSSAASDLSYPQVSSQTHTPPSSILLPPSSPAILFIRETLYASLADQLERTPSLRKLLKKDKGRAYYASVAFAILDVASRRTQFGGGEMGARPRSSTSSATPTPLQGEIIGVLGKSLTLPECPPPLQPFMVELLEIGREARRIEEEDDENAIRAVSGDKAVPTPRMERVRTLLECGLGERMDDPNHKDEANHSSGSGRGNEREHRTSPTKLKKVSSHASVSPQRPTSTSTPTLKHRKTRSIQGRAVSFANRINALALRLTALREFRDRQGEVFKVLEGVGGI